MKTIKKSSYTKVSFDFRKKYKNEGSEIYAYFKKTNVESKRRKTDKSAASLSTQEIYKQFRNTVKEFRSEGKTIKQSIESTLRTRSYKSQEEFYNTEFIKEIKKNKGVYNRLREDSKVNGHFAPIKWETLKYQGTEEVSGEVYKIYTIETTKGMRFILRVNSPRTQNYSLIYSEFPLF